LHALRQHSALRHRSSPSQLVLWSRISCTRSVSTPRSDTDRLRHSLYSGVVFLARAPSALRAPTLIVSVTACTLLDVYFVVHLHGRSSTHCAQFGDRCELTVIPAGSLFLQLLLTNVLLKICTFTTALLLLVRGARQPHLALFSKYLCKRNS
jgi:hypothetical protein